MTPLAPPPPPTVPRLVEDVVPDDRDDPEIITNTTTVSYSSYADAKLQITKIILLISAKSTEQAGMLLHTTKVIRVSVNNPV